MNNILGGDFITFQYRHRKEIIISVLIILIIAGGIFFYFYTKDEKEETPIITKKKTKVIKEKEENTENISVDIKGEIINPGIYYMKPSTRVIDVIDKAGGLTENADTSVINLSKKVTDEMVIIVYSKEQVKKFEETKTKEELVQEKCKKVDENSLENDACITSKNTEVASGKININTAPKEVLMTISGIGESKAEDIINYREANGAFKTKEEIKNVPGIGDSIYSKIEETITVG